MHSCTHVLLGSISAPPSNACNVVRPPRPPLLPSYLAAALLCLDRAGPPVTDTGCTGAPFLVDNKRKRLAAACMDATLPATSKQLASSTSACMHGHAQTHTEPCTPHPTYSTSTTHWHTSSFIKPVPAQNAASVLHMISVLLFLIFSDEEHKSDWWLAFSPLSFVNY